MVFCGNCLDGAVNFLGTAPQLFLEGPRMANLIPVLQSLATSRAYVEMLDGHPQVSATELAKCEAILGQIESALEEAINVPCQSLQPCWKAVPPTD